MHKLEIALKDKLFDSEGESIRKKCKEYFKINIKQIRIVNVLTIDAKIKENELIKIQQEIFTNPVTQNSSFFPLEIDCDWIIIITLQAGTKDNLGDTAKEAIEDILKIKFKENEKVYSAKRYCIKGENLNFEMIEKIAEQLLANNIIQKWEIYTQKEWGKSKNKIKIPKAGFSHKAQVQEFDIFKKGALEKISQERDLSLNPNDIPNIVKYFSDKDVIKKRAEKKLQLPTDIELEYISQARSDHCNHNTFKGLFYYQESKDAKIEKEDNLFKKYIESPTLKLKKEKNWVVSVLWDNAGVGSFDDNFNYTITGETHNSPSNLEAYGGAITGIVGVYRDPLGTGLASKLIMGAYGYCVGHQNYNGQLKPKLHPRRLLDGVVEGVKDGGNKSGVPTTFGNLIFDDSYIGKSLVFVTALGIMPKKINKSPSHLKDIDNKDLIIMCGGLVGKDGIHGVTASSESLSEQTPSSHVQIGDPYTQKKMHDFILEARDKNLIKFITDNGGGGLSSSIGESARFSGGCVVELDKVPLKYSGLDPWEIWISESQERMTIAISPDKLDEFMSLSKKHSVKSTVIGQYTNSGFLEILFNKKCIAYILVEFLSSSFPQWEFSAVWESPEKRGLIEPIIGKTKDYNMLLCDMMMRANIVSKQWIHKQYDHEVQGGSVIKAYIGKNCDIPSDASVFRPVLNSSKAIAFSSSMIPFYSQIDAYHMCTCTIDEATRRILSVGGKTEHIAGVDNFCWPQIIYDKEKNPDGKFKAAQLVRACKGLKDICDAYKIPLLSGKDSMYADGYIEGKYGETHKISSLETIQFSCASVLEDIEKCISMDAKMEGDIIYLIGNTKNELGASEYYEHLGYIGANVPKVEKDKFFDYYKIVEASISQSLLASAHGIYRGGIAIHAPLIVMAQDFGLDIDLSKILCDQDAKKNETILFSESQGRFIVTVDPKNQRKFENLFKGKNIISKIGIVTKEPIIKIMGLDKKYIINLKTSKLKKYFTNKA